MPRPLPQPAPVVAAIEAPAVTPDVATSQPVLRPVLDAAALPEPTSPSSPAGAAAVLAVAEGEATYYASKFDGRRTASGIVFRNDGMTAAHRTWPFGTRVRVTGVSNGRSVIVTIEDRGPHGASARQRRTTIDLSQAAARELGFMNAGRTAVRVEVLEWGS